MAALLADMTDVLTAVLLAAALLTAALLTAALPGPAFVPAKKQQKESVAVAKSLPPLCGGTRGLGSQSPTSHAG
jgi:hypothetical protein